MVKKSYQVTNKMAIMNFTALLAELQQETETDERLLPKQTSVYGQQLPLKRRRSWVGGEFTFIFVYFWRKIPPLARAYSFTNFLDHTQRRTTVGRTPLDV